MGVVVVVEAVGEVGVGDGERTALAKFIVGVVVMDVGCEGDRSSPFADKVGFLSGGSMKEETKKGVHGKGESSWPGNPYRHLNPSK
jgi:hypothetical protein